MNRSFLSAALPILLAATATLPTVTAFAADPATAPASTAASASAAAAAAPQIDESALALLQKVQTTMLGLKTYQADSMTNYTFNPTADGKQNPPMNILATVTESKPNLMRYEQWTVTPSGQGMWTKKSDTPNSIVVSDGKNIYQQFGKTYRSLPLKSPEQIAASGPWGGFYATNTSPYAEVQSAKEHGQLVAVRGLGDETVDGVLCQKVLVDWKPNGAELKETWFVGPDNLVHRKTQEIATSQMSYTVEATVRNIKTDAPVADSAKLFAYTPTAGVTLYVPKPQPVLLANGTAAPEITAVDKNGKTVKLSDFKGKVVVVDFWASWCPPCKASMPHNQEVTKKLQDAKVPMVLLAVDNSEEQPPFAKWVGEHPEYSSLQFVYADPKTHSVSGDDYHVSGIPTQYVIDGKGIIRASFVGYGGPNDDMEKAVRAAITGTSVASK